MPYLSSLFTGVRDHTVLLSFLLMYILGPGSFIEVRKIISLLTASSPDHPSFHVVALSLPGYAFSEAPRNKGFSGPQYAEVCLGLFNCLQLIDDCVARTQVDAFPRIRGVCHSRRGLGAFRELAFSALPHLILTDQLRSLGLWRTPMDLRMSKRGILILQRTSPIYLGALLPAHLYTLHTQGNVTATSVL